MNEFLEFLKTFIGKGVSLSTQDAENLAVQLRSSPVTQPLYQHLFDLGHGQATKDFRTKETELNNQITTLTEQRDKLKKDYEALEGKTPDVQKVRTEMQGEIDKLNDQIKGLNKQHKQQRIEWYRERELSKLKDHLISRGVDPDWAQVMVERDDIKARLKVTEADDGKGTVEVLKAGSDSIALQGDKPLELLADELRKDVKPNFLTSKADGGSGSRKGSEGGGSKDVFERAREEGKAAHSGGRPDGFKSGAERLGATGAK